MIVGVDKGELNVSIADHIFGTSQVCAIWLRQPQLLRANSLFLGVLAIMEVSRHIFDQWKFGKAASYHSYLAKSWGLVMGIAVIGILCFGGPTWPLSVSILVGIAADVEGLTMSILLPVWQHDVKSLPAALRLRQTICSAQGAASRSSL